MASARHKSVILVKNKPFFFKYQINQNVISLSSTHLHYINRAPNAFFQVNHYSKKNFFSEFIENIKNDMEKNKQMKENLSKFREEAEKLEQSDALKKAREKYQSIEAETYKNTQVLRQKLDLIQDKLKETLSEAEKTELAKKSRELAAEISRQAGKAAETVSKGTEQIGDSKIFKSVSEGVKAVKEEIDDTALSRARTYRAPDVLRKREETRLSNTENKPMEADHESIGMVMHKDSKWSQNWQSFKDNNQYVNKLFSLKSKYDESDHMFVRATRAFTDKMSDLFGGMFQKTEMSEVLTEICKMDPNFDKEQFIKEFHREIIPNVLEAIVRGDVEIIKDWCHEAVYNTITHPIKQAQAAGYKLQSKVLDISHVDIVAAKMMEQGPVLVFTFYAQQIMLVTDRLGKVVEGDAEKIMRVLHVWALCRDPTILDPRSAWRVIDLSFSPAEQWV